MDIFSNLNKLSSCGLNTLLCLAEDFYLEKFSWLTEGKKLTLFNLGLVQLTCLLLDQTDTIA